MPGIVYYLAAWYPKKDLAIRMGFFFSASAFASGFSGLLAFGIGHLSGKWLEPWRWLFIIDGVPSIICGILIWFYLPNQPNSASFLDQEEQSAWMDLLLEENDQSFSHDISWMDVKAALLDFKNW